MDRSDKFLIFITIAAVGIFIFLTTINNIFFQLILYVTFIPLATMFVKLIINKGKMRRIRNNIFDFVVHPTLTPLVTFLQNHGTSPEQIDLFIRESKQSFNKESDVTPTIVNMCNLFTKLQKVDKQFQVSYTLAVSHSLTVLMDVKEGQAAREIDSSVIRRKSIRCGNEKWIITDYDLDWYKRFSESEKILHVPFVEVYNEVKDIGISELEEKRDQVQNKVAELTKYLEEHEEKLNKLLGLIMRRIPEVDFFKILSSLRTEIVIISSQGLRDQSEYESSIRGSKYFNQALDEKGLNYGRLNYSVRFVFLNDIMKGSDPRYFNLQNWGRQIENRAKELRESEHGNERKFNFAILKSSLQDLQFFGDKIDKGRIRIPLEILDGLKTEDVTYSTLMIIAKALQQKSISLREFIDKNLEYLDGIQSEEIAKKIVEVLGKKYGKTNWSISDFMRHDVKIKDLVELGIAEGSARKVISEAKSISDLLKW